jgi:hypothetical protein
MINGRYSDVIAFVLSFLQILSSNSLFKFSSLQILFSSNSLLLFSSSLLVSSSSLLLFFSSLLFFFSSPPPLLLFVSYRVFSESDASLWKLAERVFHFAIFLGGNSYRLTFGLVWRIGETRNGSDAFRFTVRLDAG